MVQPTISTGYFLELTDKTGCKNFDVMTVFVRDSLPVFLPNTFSPNDDGINDYFTAFANAKIEKIKRLAIFNRWGNLLFEAKDIPTNDSSKGWDGTFLNVMQAQDLYIYTVEIALWDDTVKVLKGEVMLLR
jgi:gliding motility-associated-like protein